MSTSTLGKWQAIEGLVSEMKRCDESGLITASVAMAFVCIDSLANLGRPEDKARVTRSDFKGWVDEHLKGHTDQPYQYRGMDVYAARCAFLHTYGSESELHQEEPSTIKFGYHDGGMHQYNPEIDPSFVIIGTRSFTNDVAQAVGSFLNKCRSDSFLRNRVEQRLDGFLKQFPYPAQCAHT